MSKFIVGDCIKQDDENVTAIGIIVSQGYNAFTINMIYMNPNRYYCENTDGTISMFTDQVERTFVKIDDKECLAGVLKS
jgi:hypothetical protein